MNNKVMDFELKFDYLESLKRENFTQSQIDVLRESVKSCAIVPKSLTNKQVNTRLNLLMIYLGVNYNPHHDIAAFGGSSRVRRRC